ncbi:MAG TPA: phosphoserine transaminase [Actinomycetota bacterium]|jgi:phosphoserine aminotransferase|nr:phosphoserine transaminase [Actinomycetota bacterium]
MIGERRDDTSITIPDDLRPRDGRFGSGPSKVRAEAVAALGSTGTAYLGTSHRQPGVREVVAAIRSGLASLYELPDGYEVALGNGGSTLFWDAMAFSLIERKSQHAVFGEFSSKCARAADAPHLDTPDVIESEPGTHPMMYAREDVDLYALTHNETSTGVMMPVRRPSPRAFVAVDGTSAAGGIEVDPTRFDVYYFAPQKCFAADGGLWIALLSPAAVERIDRLHRARYIPAILDLQTALENSRKDQTYNTPALATLFLTLRQIEWMAENGGLGWAAERSRTSSSLLYEWSERSGFAAPFVKDPDQRSPVVVTIDFHDDVDAATIARVLRANGIVDTEPYRKLGRNQLRIATYPAIDPGDVETLCAAIDFVVERLTAP